MAYGDIAKSKLDNLVLDTTGLSSIVLNVDGDIWAVAYVGPDNDGWIKTFSCTEEGVLGDAVIASLEFESTHCSQYHLDFKKISGTTYAVVYRDVSGSYGGVGELRTLTINNDGTIDGLIANWQFSTGAGFPQLLQRSGTTWIIFFNDTYVGQGVVGTTTINNDGTLGAAWIDRTFCGTTCRNNRIAVANGDYYICAYNNTLAQGQISTITIDSSGNVGDAFTDTDQFDTSIEAIGNILELASNYFCVSYDSDAAYFQSFTVNGSGATTLIGNQAYGTDTPSTWMTTLYGTTMRAVCYEESGPTSVVETWGISNIGVINGTAQDSWLFDNPGEDPYLIYLDNEDYHLIVGLTGSGLEAITYTMETAAAKAFIPKVIMI